MSNKEIELKEIIDFISKTLGISTKEAEQKVINLQEAMARIVTVSTLSIDDTAYGLNQLSALSHKEIKLVDTSRITNPASRKYKSKKFR